ncbi:ABC transporter ATP-binding protein [Corallococcus sp. M34]|uniref:ABC transporter ATP-binding protein n=1 Tax=Citreicoccus inhibens TaxID=2849499 RepID=UPI001C21B41E|nr:ABC transporter ATP-binding protein [Citreicoccus inhibens]MBU8898584.1 ABC transporter ATP-binding protein [Citreicoccus inhibens]
MATIVLDGVVKAYGKNPVVRGLSLEVHEGELLSLLGPSGCGKTTTLRMLAGLEHPDQGTIDIGGTRVAGPGVRVPPERRGLGMVFQSYAVWPNRSVEANVAYPLALRRLARSEISERVRTALRWVRLEAFAERMPHELSGGQLQRVALARALVSNPRVLLLDEPLSNLDAALREELRAELAALRERLGTTLVFVTHDQAEALALSDRIAVMNGGVLEQVDAPERLYHAPASAFVARFVGGANVLPGVVRDGVFHCAQSEATFALPNEVARSEGPATLVLRPEDLELGTEGTPLPLAARLFLGNSVEYRFAVGTSLLRVVAPPMEGVRTGQVLRIRARRARVFAAP